jgi:DNA polymerase II large subunit
MQDHTRKITRAKKAGNVAQVIQNLPSKYKVLSSNPSTTKRVSEVTKKTEKLGLPKPLVDLIEVMKSRGRGG